MRFVNTSLKRLCLALSLSGLTITLIGNSSHMSVDSNSSAKVGAVSEGVASTQGALPFASGTTEDVSQDATVNDIGTVSGWEGDSFNTDSLYFPLQVFSSTGQSAVKVAMLDTGSYALLVGSSTAQELGLPNLGDVQVWGIGGQSSAYDSQISFIIGKHRFTDVPCVVVPDADTDSTILFGIQWLRDNNFNLDINLSKNQFTIYH